MNRPIKFRAWAHASNFMFAPDADTGWELLGGEIYPVPNVTLMQFTGLHDKNGKEIWEGDICYYTGSGPNHHTNMIICWSEYHSGWAMSRYSKPEGFAPISIYANALKNRPDFEVIGNIYENPELLSHPTDSNQDERSGR